MKVSDYAQGKVFLTSILLGVLCVVLFDVFAVLRHRVGKSRIGVNAFDFLYLIFAFLLVFITGVKINFGALRYYQIIGIALGIAVYHKLFSRMERLLLGKLFDFINLIICLILKIIYKALMLAVRIIASPVVLIEDKIIKLILRVKKIRKKQSFRREKNKKTVKKRLKML